MRATPPCSQEALVDWTAAIEMNQAALKRVPAMLVAMTGLGGQFTFFPQKGADASRLAWGEKSRLSPAPVIAPRLRRAVPRLLRPAEAAARRLLIVMARGLAEPPSRERQARRR